MTETVALTATDPAPATGLTASESSVGAPPVAGAEATAQPTLLTAVEYTDFVMPEGLPIDTEVMGDFKGVATEYKLSQEQAQKVADLGVKLHQRWAESLIKDSDAYLDSLFDPAAESKGDMFGGPFKARSEKWAEAAKADKEFGGDKLPESLSVISKARDALTTPELMSFFEKTGLGNHPEVLRMFFKAGKMLSDDSFVNGTRRPTTSEKTLEQRMYPGMN